MRLLTAFTDYALAAAGVFFALRLEFARRTRPMPAARLWSAAFLATAVAGVSGGTYHGLEVTIDAPPGLVLWKVTVYAVGLTGFFALCATAAVIRRPTIRYALITGASLEFLAYALWMAAHNNFRYAVYDYAAALLIVLLFQAWAGVVRREAGAGWISAGVLLSFAGAGIQRAGWPGYARFNHNDLYHLVQIAALYLFYRGARIVHNR